MCLRTGGVKLLDFGIAKALGEPEVEKTGHGVFKGKLSYIAPERIKDLPVDARADLFALGAVLWEMLAGRKLFRGKSDFETLKNVAEMEVPSPSSIRPDVPPELDRIVARALARDPAERYPTGAGAGRRSGPRAGDAAPPAAGAARSFARAVRRRALLPSDSNDDADHRDAGRLQGRFFERQRQRWRRTRRRRIPTPCGAAACARARRVQHLDRGGGAGPAAVAVALLGRRERRDRHAAAVAGGARRWRPLAGGDAAAPRPVVRRSPPSRDPALHAARRSRARSKQRQGPGAAANPGRGACRRRIVRRQARTSRARVGQGANCPRPLGRSVRRGGLAGGAMTARGGRRSRPSSRSRSSSARLGAPAALAAPNAAEREARRRLRRSASSPTAPAVTPRPWPCTRPATRRCRCRGFW